MGSKGTKKYFLTLIWHNNINNLLMLSIKKVSYLNKFLMAHNTNTFIPILMMLCY